MVIISNKADHTSDIALADLYYRMTKPQMLKIAGKLSIPVSGNLWRYETAKRIGQAVLDYPECVLCSLSKAEHGLLQRFIEAGPNTYVVTKTRKMPYKLQRLGLVMTYVDEGNDEWHMLMPDTVREALGSFGTYFTDLIKAGKRLPSLREVLLNRIWHRMYGVKFHGDKGE